MNRIMKHGKTVALVLTLALALLLPVAALAGDGTPPVATLYSPTVSASTSNNQKIIFRLDEQVSLVGGVSITITADDSTYYTADAASGTLLGNQSTGPWYVSYDLSDFQYSGTQLSLTASTIYKVAVGEGAFADTTSASDAMNDSFTTAADGVAVIFTKTNDAQSVSVDGSTIASGQAVSAGKALTYSLDDVGYTLARTVKIGGAITAPATLPATVPSGDLELYFVRSEGMLTGTVAITGNLTCGSELSGTVSESNQTDTGKLFFRWVRETGSGDVTRASGSYGTKYKLEADDVGKLIRLDVVGAVNDGVINTKTTAISKAAFSETVIAPVAETTTSTSITLKEVPGYEYSSNGTDFSSTRTFSVAGASMTVTLYQRAAETATTLASAAASGSFTSSAALSGTVSFNTTAQYNVDLIATLSGASGTLIYSWVREGSATVIGMAQTYKPKAEDINKKLTVTITSSTQSGSVSGTTAAVLKAANATTPSAPTMASATATSITLNAVSGYQYSLGGTNWQDTTTFHNLAAGSAYTFYQRVAETSTTLASAVSSPVNFSTQAALSGTIMSSGEARYGSTLVVSLSGTNNTGTLTYTWKRGTVAVGSGTSYAVQAADVSNQLSVEVTSSVQGGSVTRSFGTVSKAYYYGDTPSAPTRSSRTTTKIVLTSVSGCEYSRDGSNWQDSTTFSGLSAGKSYTFYQRYAATATMEASPTSAAYKTSTSSASSDSGSSSATPTPKPTSSDGSGTDDSGATTLYSYTLTSDNTRILYSTMKSLAAGNKAQDVTIKQDNVEITFPKGTMTDSYTQLWYDFGTTINNSIAEQTAKEIAGDAYVATIHFNYSGDLPAEAKIRFWLGAANAGKTLYYYRLEDDKTLTFLQSSVVDSTGWASVTQKSCSDYVFLSSEYGAAAASPTPLPSASAGVSPSSTPLIAAEQPIAGMGADGWLVIAIVLIAVALIVGGIWLYTKSRDTRNDDDDEDF
ncbi:MAG: hypothetical protein LLF75_02710 [Eubacteriales bacterium]|nr:hypothetical protein [Eubacteriales bacterium]